MGPIFDFKNAFPVIFVSGAVSITSAAVYCVLFNLFSRTLVKISIVFTSFGFMILGAGVHLNHNRVEIEQWDLIIKIASIIFFTAGALIFLVFVICYKRL